MLLESPGESYLRYVQLPEWHPRWQEIANAISDAIVDAAENALTEELRDDPIGEALMSGTTLPWVWVDICVDDLRAGTRISVSDWEGWLRDPDPDDTWRLERDEVAASLRPMERAQWRQVPPVVKRGQVVTAYVPVPVTFG